MILNIKLVGTVTAILVMTAAILLANEAYVFAFVCIVCLGLISSYIKKHEKYYESELDELYPDDRLE